MLEQELIHKTIKNLNQQTGLGIDCRVFENGNIDGELVLPNVKQRLQVECKKWLNKANIQKYLAELTLKNVITDVILITEYINPNQATRLKDHKVPFIDLAGNAYINTPPVYIDIQGKKLEKPTQEITLAKQLGKAFQPKGMKVVFMLLAHPELLKEPMRTIAETAEVALGTVKQVIDDLLYQGFIIQKNTRNNKGAIKEMINPQDLLDKWLDAYPTTVEAKLNKEVYTTDNLELLRSLDLTDINALWGGEYAVELCDNYLNAKDYLLYVQPEHKNQILKTARLRKAKTNEILNKTTARVILAEPPLGIKKIEGKQDNVAHPYFIYANLLASLEPRNIDAARRFYENHIA
ncbi:type IV toxin-antitoxin system AbiEi family antitoxin [Pseudoalteromonas sp. bablab_jr011]|jgi:hypothetical protein|uniref:type IV toxin-antitoxin system AbiEi family antitoxin n=1 Tax=Pseudoalteromonas sp. bablab_jr011 TaxID=2755062 RepID=UPI0018F49A21|nr:type IV toxin-antitoxin system AbiEi family antitoxin [Pseudoalteromonas sp. bablab_jr011]